MNETAIAQVPKVNRVQDNEIMAFAQAVQNNILAEDRVNYPNLDPVQLSVIFGRKFTRLFYARHPGADDCVYAFLDRATGDIYKPTSRKVPAKHARGNIRQGDQSNWWNGVLSAGGVRYL
jgi:hypothetical protein